MNLRQNIHYQHVFKKSLNYTLAHDGTNNTIMVNLHWHIYIYEYIHLYNQPFFAAQQLLHHMIFPTRLVGWCLALSNSPPEVQPHPTSSRFLQMASSSSSQLPKCNVKCSTQRCNALPGKPWSKTSKKKQQLKTAVTPGEIRWSVETPSVFGTNGLWIFPPKKNTEHVKCRWRMESLEDRTYVYLQIFVSDYPPKSLT